jgi:uncharacterized protein
MWFLKLLAIGAAAYLLVLLAAFFFQSSLLFPAHLANASEPLPGGTQRVAVTIASGHRLHGIHIQPTRRNGLEKLVLMGFGGNAWNAGNVAAFLHGLYPEADVVAFHYRGYGPSGGEPSAEALLLDAPFLHDYVAESLKADRVVAVGFSVGSAVAAHLASRRELAGLILVTPFDSLAAVAHDHYPWLPTGLLLRHRMAPAEDMQGIDTPTAIIAAENDTLIRPERTDALRRVLGHIVLDQTIADVGHNDIYDRAAFHHAMTEALRRMDSSSV